MTAVQTLSPPAPAPRRWTKAEYRRLAEQGYFDNMRVELVEGEIVDMGLQTELHLNAVLLVIEALRTIFAQGFVVRIPGPLSLTPDSDPEPDVAVVPGSPRDYVGMRGHPTGALLIVEVALSSLQYDRTTKASLYAKAGIADYWIVNLVDRTLEIRRRPVADSAAEFGHGYAETTILTERESASPLAAPGARVAVSDLLP